MFSPDNSMQLVALCHSYMCEITKVTDNKTKPVLISKLAFQPIPESKSYILWKRVLSVDSKYFGRGK